ncbi:MAG: helical backbone metal receptor [Planctomycetes bacterium]|nr:helical backbone metal receptor [Planctomycetota bacterium]
MKITDLTFTELDIPQPVTRAVSLVPSVTETLFALGKGGALVGRTAFCIQPAGEVEGIETVGGTKSPNLDRIIELQPQLVLANKEENRRQDIDTLRAAGIAVHVAQPTTVEEGLAYVTTCGRIFECEPEAERITRAGVKELVRIREHVSEQIALRRLRRKRPPESAERPRVICFVWNNPWMAVGSDTYIGDMISTLGGDNVYNLAADRYFAVDPVEVAAHNPDILLFPDEPCAFTDHDLKFWRDNFADMPAVKNNRLRPCGGQDLCWFGARIPQALKRLQPILSR